MKKPGMPEAFTSGMRGREEPPVATQNSPGEEAATPPPEGEGAKMEDFVHGPDENGHHHLNISKLHEHLHGKKHGA
jgi:hypothetical protein